MAEIALEAVAIECVRGGPSRLLMPFQELISKVSLWVALSDRIIDSLPVHAGGVGTRAGFEVMANAACGCETSFAKGAWDVGTTVGV